MTARTAFEELRRMVSLQRGLWGQILASSADPMMPGLANLQKSGAVTLDGSTWKFQRHGGGVVFTDSSGRRTVDIHEARRGPEYFDAWAVSRHFGALGNEGDRLMTEAGQVAGGGLEARVNEWLRDLAAKGLIVAEGDGYRLGDACDNG
ncbi:MAG: hypothetical protein IPM79_39985 [Polyangiaceae bacterium]|nr:hypothetical protein [Polyangiaceae bacterium]MBK8943616.1 hypothetical protein [Polyangiaceae bacterium]